MKQPVHGDRLAVVGCGAAAEWLHLPALRRIGWDPELLIDPNLERARMLADQIGAKSASDHVDHLQAFDAALVAVPHALHDPLARSLLEQGKPVFVEKPMALTSADCERMIATAASTGVPLAVGLMRRHLRAARWLKAFLDEGALGRVESFDVRDGFVYEWMVTSDAIWRREKAGGGVLMDVGVHVLDLLLWWLGPFADLSYKDDSYGGVEADCLIELTTPDGARGVVELSRTRGLRQSAIIRGEKGWIEIGIDSNRLRAEPEDLLDLRFNGVRGRSIKEQTSDALYEAQLSDWRRVLTDGGEPAVPGREAIDSVALIERCYQARQEWALPWVRNSEMSADVRP
jgi:predicted dehydrogenase